MTRPLLIGISAFLVWSAGSGYWYMCKIKGACIDEVAAPATVSGTIDLAESEENPDSESDTSAANENIVVGTAPDSLDAPASAVPSGINGKASVLFAYTRPIIYRRPDIMLYIKEASRWLIDNPGNQIRITGYTDDAATRESNLKLGMARAEAMAQRFRAAGVPERQMILESKGEQDPVASNETLEGRRENRRVEMQLVQ